MNFDELKVGMSEFEIFIISEEIIDNFANLSERL